MGLSRSFGGHCLR